MGYLANEIQSLDMPLFINLNPKIGFVFIYKGEEMIHFIWELLNSNATYIWSAKGKVLKESITKIEEEISMIKELGRSQYRHEFLNTPQLYFNFVIHKTSKSSIDDPFPQWIYKVNELLV